MKYLGIKIDDHKLGMASLNDIPEKIRKRLPRWKGKNMSTRARVILNNTFE